VNPAAESEVLSFAEFKSFVLSIGDASEENAIVREFVSFIRAGCSEVEAKRWLKVHLDEFPVEMRAAITQAFLEDARRVLSKTENATGCAHTRKLIGSFSPSPGVRPTAQATEGTGRQPADIVCELEPYFHDPQTGLCFQDAVAEVYVEAELRRGWDNPAFQRRYAQAHTAELLSQAAEIREETRELFRMRGLSAYFAERYPVGFRRLCGRLDALHIAEELSCDVDEPTPQAHKPTTTEWRERQLRRAKTQLEDEEAKDLLAIEGALRRLALLDEKEKEIRKSADLTDEQKERAIQAMTAVLAARLQSQGEEGNDNAIKDPKIL